MSNVIKVNFARRWFQHLEELIHRHLESGGFPGIEILFASQGEVHLHQAWGHLELGKDAPTLQPNTLFDIASITKPVATATAIMLLLERGFLDLEDKVVEFIPEFDSEVYRQITLRHLLCHTSGLPAWANLYEGVTSKQEAWERLIAVSVDHGIQEKMIYSCLGFLILGEIIRRVTKQSLSEFTQRNIFKPLNMEATGFSPWKTQRILPIAPTQFCPFRKKLLRGVVHDENSYVFDEEGGNSGLFSTASDLFRFCQMIFHGGALEGEHILSPHSIHRMSQNHNPSHLPPRGLGWDIVADGFGYMSGGDLFPRGGIGHLGFTGTSLWLHPPTQTAIIVLTNRVHLSREQNLSQMRTFRPRLHNILMASLDGERR